MLLFNNIPKPLKIYKSFNLDVTTESDQYVSDCPFCSDEGHFYFHQETGLFDCKKCGVSGNPTTFLRQYIKDVASRDQQDYVKLSKKRGIRISVLREWDVCRAEDIGQWILPMHNTAGTVCSGQLYDPEATGKRNKWNIGGLDTRLFGLHLLTDDRPIILCEGAFDAMIVYDYLFRHGVEDEFDVLGAPGSQFMPYEAIKHFSGREVYVCYDHDQGGEKGWNLVKKRLKQNRLYRFAWEEMEGVKAGTDMEDLLNGYNIPNIAEYIQKMSVLEHDPETVALSQLSQLSHCHNVTEPFPLEVFPKPLKNLCQVGAKSTSSPVDFIAAPMLVGGAVALGSGRRLEVKPNYVVHPVLWLGLVGQSGVRKSPGRDIALEPFERMQERFILEWQASRRSGIETPQRVIKTHDATMEALLKLLEENPHGLLYDTDELMGWLNQQDRFANGDDQQKWLSMFSGKSLSQKRITEGRDRAVTNPIVNVCGGLTPGSLERFTAKGRSENGFFARMIFSFPEGVEKQWDRKGINSRYLRAYRQVINTIYEESQAPDTTNRVTMSKQALDRWEQWYVDHYREQDSLDDETLSPFYDKLEAYLARFALIIQELWRASGTNYDPSKIHLDNLNRGIQLISYFKSHITKTVGATVQTSRKQKGEKVKAWVEDQGLQKVSTRDISRLLHCKTSDDAKQVMEALEESGYGTIEQERQNRWVLHVTA